MVNALAIGIKYNEFWHLTPVKLEYYLKAYKKQRMMQDENNWMLGRYIHIAVISAMDKAFNGKKSTVEYLEKPLMVYAEEEANITEEERIKRELDKMIANEEKWSIIAQKQGLPKT